MFETIDASPTLPVRNLEAARKFYEEKLGLTATKGDEPVLRFRCGSTTLLVYESKFAGTNLGTAVTWMVDDVDATAAELRSKGVTFEHYDMPGATVEKDVYRFGDLKNAWFKDPDGNIHSVVSR